MKEASQLHSDAAHHLLDGCMLLRQFKLGYGGIGNAFPLHALVRLVPLLKEADLRASMLAKALEECESHRRR